MQSNGQESALGQVLLNFTNMTSPLIYKDLYQFYMLNIHEFPNIKTDFSWVVSFLKANDMYQQVIRSYEIYVSQLAQPFHPSYFHNIHDDKKKRNRVYQEKRQQIDDRKEEASRKAQAQAQAQAAQAQAQQARQAQRAKQEQRKKQQQRLTLQRQKAAQQQALRKAKPKEISTVGMLSPDLLKIIASLKDSVNVSENCLAMLQKYKDRKCKPLQPPIEANAIRNSDKKNTQQQSNRKGAQISRGTRGNDSGQPSVGISRMQQSAELKQMKERIRSQQEFSKRLQQQAKTEVEHFRRDAKFNLNLLTPENFDIQKKVFEGLARVKRESCDVLIEQLIEKAWNEQKYCSTYAKMCTELKDVKPKECEQSFKDLLVGKVQNIFTNKAYKTKEGDQSLAKKKFVGNMKFIAELINVRVLAKKIAFFCFHHLLKQFLDEMRSGKSTPQLNLEGIVILIQQCGKFLQSKEKQSKQDAYESQLLLAAKGFSLNGDIDRLYNAIDNAGKIRLFGVCELLQTISYHKNFNKRVQILVRNLIDRRARGWQKVDNLAPKTIKDLELDDQQDNKKVINKRTFQSLKRDVKTLMVKGVSEDTHKAMMKHLHGLVKQNHQSDVFDALLLNFCEVTQDSAKLRKNILVEFVEDCGSLFSKQKFLESWQSNIKKIANYKSQFVFMATLWANNLSQMRRRFKWPNISDLKVAVDPDGEDDQEFIDLIKIILAKWTKLQPELTSDAEKLLQDMGIGEKMEDLYGLSSVKRHDI